MPTFRIAEILSPPVSVLAEAGNAIRYFYFEGSYNQLNVDILEDPTWRSRDTRRQRRFAVHEDDVGFLMYAHAWGAETALPYDELAPVYNSTYASNAASDFLIRLPKPGSFRFKPGVEKQAADYLSGHVKDALLEVPRIAFSHFHHRVNQFANYRAPYLTDAKLKETMDEYVRTNFSGTVDLAQKAATAALEFEHELDAKFKAAGSDFRKVLAVCGEYIDGTFGVDWHCSRFFDRYRKGEKQPEYTRIETEQDEVVRVLDDDAKRRRFGAASTHFAASSLGPLFRRFPALATIHHHAG